MYDLHINTAHQGRMSRVYKPLDNCVVQYLTMHRWIYNIVFSDRFSCTPRSGELRTQKLKSHLARTQSLNVLPLKPRVGQYIAIHATLTARDFFLAYFYTSCPFTCIFSKTSPNFSPCWLWLTHGSCVGSQNKIGHPAGGTCFAECRQNINRLRKKNMTCGVMTCEMNNLEIE